MNCCLFKFEMLVKGWFFFFFFGGGGFRFIDKENKVETPFFIFSWCNYLSRMKGNFHVRF